MEAAEGVFVLFAAGVGQTALDRLTDDDLDPNSVFTRSFVPLLKQGGLSQVDLAKQVQSKVAALAASIGHNQKPAYYDQLLGFVSLNDKAKSVVEANPDIAPSSSAAQDWALVEKSKSPAAVQFFIDKYKDEPIFRSLAEEKLALLVPKKPPEPTQEQCSGVVAKVTGTETCLKPKDTFRDCASCPEMVVVPAGSFMMGSPEDEAGRREDEGPQHKVTIARLLAVGKFEITRGQFEAFVKDTNFAVSDSCSFWNGTEFKDTKGKSFRDPGFKQTDDHPVVCVSWDDASAYIKWLSKKTGQTYRLLTEAEWEYAARAGTTTTYSTGRSIETTQANFNNTLGATVSVGKYAANDFGLKDMHGNVWEWNQDCYVDSYKDAPNDGSATKDSNSCFRVGRGGGWNYSLQGLRSAFRTRSSPGIRFSTLGFRLARTF